MKIKMILLVFLMLILAYGCTKPVKSTEPVEISFWVPFQNNSGPPVDAWIKIYQTAIVNFNKINPFITVTLKFNSANFYDFDDTIKLLEDESPPDIIPIPPLQRFKAEEKGLLADFYQLQKSTGSDPIDINQRILDSVTIGGKLSILPYAAIPQAMIYNKEMFDEAKVPYPANNWTWEQFRSTSLKLKPIGDPILDYSPQMFDFLLAGKDKGVLSPDGTTAIGFLDSPEAVQTIQWLNTYYRDNKKTEPIDQQTVGGPYGQFDGNLIPMMLNYY